jgi:subtilisin-like proprotein convertase family protein
VLLANTPNDGFENVTVPTTIAATANARIKVKASGNVFFDLSNQNFTITNSSAPTFFLSPAVTRIPVICPGQSSTFAVTVGQIQSFTGQVALSATNLPTGVTVSYNNATTAAGTTVQATIAVAPGTNTGLYTLALTGTSGGVTQAQQFSLEVLPSATAAAVPVTPVSGQRVGPRPRLTWNAVPNATAYDVEIASDANFGTILLTQSNVTGTSFTVSASPLTTGTTYYWRVRGTSPCGPAPYSVVSSFQVGMLSCGTTASTQTVIIPIGSAAPVTSVLNVQGADQVGAIRINNLNITHTNVSELTISLTNPAGRTVVLLANACPGTAGINVSLNDDATAALNCPLNGGATYRPANSLASLLNDPANGNWTLTIVDNTPFANGGQLNSWSLELCTLAVPPAAPTALTTAFNGSPSASPARVNVIWLDNAVNEAGYQVERTGANDNNFALLTTLPANATFYADQITGPVGTYCYRVRSINPVGPSAYSNQSCVTTEPLSNQNAALLRGVEVYPNPSSGLFQVKVDNGQRGSITLRVTDALGRTVSSNTLSKGSAPLQHVLDLSKLNSGLYQLHLDMPEGTAVMKLLKQ